MAAPVQAQTTCNTPNTSLTFPPNKLHFDNKGQSFISAHRSNNLTKLTKVTRRVTACATQNSTPTLRRLALLAHSLISFRVQFANAYVLHEYAHTEIGHRFGTRGIIVGASPTNNGLGTIQNDSFLKNLLRMTFGAAHLFDFGYHGVGISSTAPPPKAFMRHQAQAMGQASGINLNSFLALQDFNAMLADESSPNRDLNYITNKTFAPAYFFLASSIGGDPLLYVAKLKAHGIDTSVGKIRKNQWTALLLSNGYWISLRSLRCYGQETLDIAPILGRLTGIGRSTSTVLYWPEFSTFLNKRGVSMAGELPFSLGLSGRWSLGIEGNIIGLNQGTDITGALARTLDQTQVPSKVTQNTQNGSIALASVRHQITKNASLIGQVL